MCQRTPPSNHKAKQAAMWKRRGSSRPTINNENAQKAHAAPELGWISKGPHVEKHGLEAKDVRKSWVGTGKQTQSIVIGHPTRHS